MILIIGDGSGPYPGELLFGLARPYLDATAGQPSRFASLAPHTLGRTLPPVTSGVKAQGNGWLGNDFGQWSGLYLAAQEGNETLADMHSTTTATSKAPSDVTNEAANTGNFKQGTGINTHSLDELDIEFEALGKRGNDTCEFDGEVFNKQKIFD